jgi:thiamine-phosphate pyrophosphorylase
VRLVLVTDRRVMGGDFGGAIARAVRLVGPQAIVQVREKDLAGAALLALARAAVAAARPFGARVMINDRVDVAIAAGADGVHLPENGLSVAQARALLPAGAIVGASRHTPADAAACDADLVMLGPIYATPGPGKGAPLGAASLADARGRGMLVAIGGIDSAERAAACRAAGANAVAAIRAIWTALDPALAAAALAS